MLGSVTRTSAFCTGVVVPCPKILGCDTSLVAAMATEIVPCETAQQFEGMFLQMMLKSMREATVKSDLVESSGAETFEAMFDKEVSVQLSKRNMMGVADMLVQTQSRQMSPPPSTDELLKSRGTASKGFPLNQPGKAYPLDAATPVLNPLKLPGGPFPLPKMDNLSTRSKP